MSVALTHLRCPSCRGLDARGEFRAHALQHAPGDDALRCPGCEARYPTLDGVPVLVSEPDRVVDQARRRSDVAAWCAELLEADPTSEVAREAWLLTLYAVSHHPESAPSAFVRDAMRDQGALGAEIERWLSAHTPKPGDALELGCGVGGHAALWRAACSGSVTLCDLRPDMLAVGRALHAGRAVTLPWRQMGRRHVPLTLEPEAQALSDVHYVVGDAIDPPFAAEHFELGVALNLLDAIRDPWMLLGQLDALTAPGGLLLLGQFPGGNTSPNAIEVLRHAFFVDHPQVKRPSNNIAGLWRSPRGVRRTWLREDLRGHSPGVSAEVAD